MFATKILKVSWLFKENFRILLLLLTVYEIGFICRTARLYSMIKSQIPAILALYFSFNCNASHKF